MWYIPIMKTLKKWFHRLKFLIPGLIAAVFYLLLPRFPRTAETLFARGLFRAVSTLVGGAVSVLPFSITEIMAVLTVPAFFLLLAMLIRRRLKVRFLRVCGWGLSVSVLLYMVNHGNNFYRLPVEQLLALDTSVCTSEQLMEICTDLAEKASLEREGLAEDENGTMILSENISATLRAADNGYRVLQKEYPVLWGGVWRAKPVLNSRRWSYTGTSGMYFPFFVEANVNIDQPDCDIPATAAHELAHTRGFSREDECNFFAYLSCISNESQDYRYSGYLLAYTYCANTLYRYDRTLWRKARKHCSEGVLRDLQAGTKYWKQFEGKVEKASAAVNNSFLRVQRVKDGILSYGRVVELIVGHYRSMMVI